MSAADPNSKTHKAEIARAVRLARTDAEVFARTANVTQFREVTVDLIMQLTTKVAELESDLDALKRRYYATLGKR